MSETVLGEYGIKASKMAPSQMQAVEHLAAECATLRARVAELEAERGTLPDGAHPDEAKPRAETWLAERANWTAEVERIRAWVAVLETQLATTRAEERERCRTAVEEIGIREAGHGHAVSIGSYGHATDEDFDAAKRGCHYCLRVEVIHEVVQAIDALTPTPEPPHA